MELQFEQRIVEYLRCNVRQVQNLEQTQELRLPDGMPDIGRVLCAWGQAMVRNKQWRSDGVTVGAGVQVWVLYIPEDGTEPRSVELWLPVTGKFAFQESKREGTVMVSAQVCSVDARILSARKMMVRATVGLLAQAMEKTQTTVCMPLQWPQEVQLLQRTYPAVLPREAGEKQFSVDEDIATDTAVRKILGCQVQPVVTEQTAAGGRVVLRGECRVHLMYMNESDEINTMDVSLPFAQLSELDRDYDKDASCVVWMQVNQMDIQAHDGGVHLQCALAAQYMIYERQLLEVVEDAYSPYMAVEPIMKQVELPMLLEQRKEKLDLSVQLERAANGVIAVDPMLMQPTVFREGDAVLLEVPGSLQVLYRDEEQALRCENKTWSAGLQLQAGVDSQVQVMIGSVRQIQAYCKGQQIQADGGMELAVTTMALQQIPMVTGLVLGQREAADPARPSLILQRAGNRELWEIAKVCGSTVEAITQANQLAGEPAPGQMLLIPVM